MISSVVNGLRPERNMMDPVLEWRSGVCGWSLPNGGFLPLIAGGADGDGNGGDDGGGGGGGDGDGDDDGDDGDDDDDDGEPDPDKIRDPEAKIKALEDQVNRRAQQAKKKDDSLAAAQKELKELKDRDKSESDKLLERAEQAEKTAREMEAKMADLRTEVMVLRHDELSKMAATRRDVVVRYITPNLEVDDDGQSNLEELIADLKERDPALFSGNGVAADDDGGDKTPPPSGGKARKKKDSKTDDQEALRKRFPALNR